MKSIIKRSTTLLVFIVLTACELDESKKDTNSEALFGSWDYNTSDKSFLSISHESYIHYDHLESHDCYTTRNAQVTDSNDRTFTVSYSQEQFDTLQWSVSGDELTLTAEGSSSKLKSSDYSVDDVVLCSNPNDTGKINVSINIQNLPDAIQLNNELTENYHTEFQIKTTFDINGNAKDDEGDIRFIIYHTKVSGDNPTNINTDNLDSYAYITASIISENERHVADLSKFTYTVEHERISFNVDKSDHIALSDITNSTSISITTYYTDINGEFQFDSFPDFNSYTTSGIDLGSMLDNSDDTFGASSGPIIVDIEEVSIEITP